MLITVPIAVALIEQIPPMPVAWVEEVLGPILLIGFWVIRAILSANAEAKQRPDINDRDPDDNDGLEPDDDAIRSELEEFLRRVQQGDQPQAEAQPVAQEAVVAEAAPPRGRVIEVFDDEPEATIKRRPLDPFEDPRAPTTGAGEAAKSAASARSPKLEPKRSSGAMPADSRSQTTSVSSVESRHLPESQLAEQAAHLGESIASADDRVQARLDAKFGKGLGTLEKSSLAPEPAESAEPTESAATRIAAALSSPTAVQDAVVLNEILRRPTDRW